MSILLNDAIIVFSMFTGIVEETAAILSWDQISLVLARPASFDDVQVGSSISVSGVCLSVTKLETNAMHFSVVPETLRRSKLGSLQKGQCVNLERAMKADGRLDGHIVQGHVEGVGKITSIKNIPLPPTPPPEGGGGTKKSSPSPPGGRGQGIGEKIRREEEGIGENQYGAELIIAVPSHLLPSIQPKGSIAIDGVSLTIAAIAGHSIRIALVPLTISETTLGSLTKGDYVNIETDILARRATMHP